MLIGTVHENDGHDDDGGDIGDDGGGDMDNDENYAGNDDENARGHDHCDEDTRTTLPNDAEAW